MKQNHSFDVEIAQQYGVEEAVLLMHFVFWIKKNLYSASQENLHNGRYWTYDTTAGMAKHFPYWTPKKIWRLINSLEKIGVLESGNFNDYWSDRTKWYTIQSPLYDEWVLGSKTENVIFQNRDLTFSKNGNSHFPKMENVHTDTNTDTNTDTISEKTSQSNLELFTPKSQKEVEIPKEIKQRKARPKFVPPTEAEVVAYFREKGYKAEVAKRAFVYYDTGGWSDSHGKKVRNWKQKMQGVWFKPENQSGARNVHDPAKYREQGQKYEGFSAINNES
jgi:hypothetical protein